jgi:hypothetical protein
VKENVRDRAAGAVSGHAGFAAVRIEDPNVKIRRRNVRAADDGNAVGAGAVMTIADLPGKGTEVTDMRQLFRLKDDVVVAEALKFGETRHLFSPSTSGRGLGEGLESVPGAVATG